MQKGKRTRKGGKVGLRLPARCREGGKQENITTVAFWASRKKPDVSRSGGIGGFFSKHIEVNPKDTGGKGEKTAVE